MPQLEHIRDPARKITQPALGGGRIQSSQSPPGRLQVGPEYIEGRQPGSHRFPALHVQVICRTGPIQIVLSVAQLQRFIQPGLRLGIDPLSVLMVCMFPEDTI